jgi:hypothetical protein
MNVWLHSIVKLRNRNYDLNQRPEGEGGMCLRYVAPVAPGCPEIGEVSAAAGSPGAKPPALRKDKPHVSLYLDKRVQRVIKEIALTYDRKAHDLYIEGINLMLRSYGKPGISDIAPKRDDAGT